MPRTVTRGTRGAGVYKGIAGFMDLKKAFNDATTKMRWEKEKLMFTEGRADVRAARGQRGATGRSLIRAGFTPTDVPSLLAGGQTGFLEPEPEGFKLSAGERQKVNAILQGLSDRVDPVTGKRIETLGEAEAFVRLQGIDPDSDPRIRPMISQFLTADKKEKRRLRTIIQNALTGAAKGVISAFGPGLRATPVGDREGRIPIPRIIRGRRRVGAGDNIQTLIDEYQTTNNPRRLQELEGQLTALGVDFVE